MKKKIVGYLLNICNCDNCQLNYNNVLIYYQPKMTYNGQWYFSGFIDYKRAPLVVPSS